MNDAAEKELRAAQSKIIDLEQALRQKDVQIDNHHRRLQVVEGSQGGGKMGWWTAFREKGLFEEFSQAEYDFYHFYNQLGQKLPRRLARTLFSSFQHSFSRYNFVLLCN